MNFAIHMNLVHLNSPGSSAYKWSEGRWRQGNRSLGHHKTHKHTLNCHAQRYREKFRVYNEPKYVCLSTWTKPVQKQWEHVNSTEEDSQSDLEMNPGPSCCEVTVLTHQRNFNSCTFFVSGGNSSTLVFWWELHQQRQINNNKKKQITKGQNTLHYWLCTFCLLFRQLSCRE